MEEYYLDNEERDLMASVERGEWVSVRNLDQAIEKHQQYARNTLRRDKWADIQIASRDLDARQPKTVENGIPNETLMAGVLHRFVAGR